ncbi:hypothetical protein H4582DRAFT_1822651, partial [Lactarius indigo]
LYSDVEGTCSGKFGFIIAVVSISDICKGMVVPGNCQAEFISRYRAIVFELFKGEVADDVIHIVTRMDIFAEVGPLNCLVSQRLLRPDLKFDPSSNPLSYISQDQVSASETFLLRRMWNKVNMSLRATQKSKS